MQRILKNFIKSFERYLTKEDFDKIENAPDSKGKIMSERLEMIFGNKKNKTKIISCSKFNWNFMVFGK